MSGFSGGSFSFSRSGHGGGLGGLLGGHSRSSFSGGRAHYGRRGHYRQRRGGCLGCLGVVALVTLTVAGGAAGLLTLLA
ncbi:hypothetical protein [Deinococcus depolymerans]|uniref:Uncharacterized protein n=1 Tax=Deinococcus depolymerans TaxID=392408 RepID=A0ABP3LH81_9DEIO